MVRRRLTMGNPKRNPRGDEICRAAAARASGREARRASAALAHRARPPVCHVVGRGGEQPGILARISMAETHVSASRDTTVAAIVTADLSHGTWAG